MVSLCFPSPIFDTDLKLGCGEVVAVCAYGSCLGGLKLMKEGDWYVLCAKAEKNEAVQLMYVGCFVRNRGWGFCVEV